MRHRQDLFVNASASTGICLDFETNSQSFAFRASARKKFEIYVDGLLRRQFIFEEAGEARVALTDPLGHKKDSCRVTLYFPSHGERGILEWVELDDGAVFTPHSFDRKWLFIGDSITQGWASDHDSLSYALRVARFFNAEYVISNNEEMKKIQAWLGHSTIAITADTYAHLDMASKVASAERIGDSLAGIG